VIVHKMTSELVVRLFLSTTNGQTIERPSSAIQTESGFFSGPGSSPLPALLAMLFHSVYHLKGPRPALAGKSEHR
jgi:hypothetical protein